MCHRPCHLLELNNEKFDVLPFEMDAWLIVIIFCTCYICRSISCSCTRSHNFCSYCHEMLIKQILESLKLCVCVQLGRDYLCLMYEIINFNISMLHFVLFYNVTCYTNSLISCIHVNIKEFRNIMCTLVVTGVIL